MKSQPAFMPLLIGILLVPFAFHVMVMPPVPAADMPEIRGVCSIVPFPTARDTGTTVFVARALAETVAAGAGRVDHRVRGGHWASNRRARDIFGQRFLALRIAGASAMDLARIFREQQDSSVVVVPWDYDPACETTLWGRSFLWTPVDSVGVFTVRLRAESHWADGRPTFDAFMADIEPYPHGIFFQHGYRGTDALGRGEGLSASEYFAYYLALPPFERYGPDSLRYREILCAWAATHPREAQRYPASEVVGWERCK
jgi:hypothetical protein